MTVRTVIDLEQLSTDTVAHITRALAMYSRSTPADQVTSEFLAVAEVVLQEHSDRRAGRRNRVVRSRPESSGVVTPVAPHGADLDGDEVPTFLTRDELALHWRVSLSSVDRWIGRDEARCVRLGRSVRIPRALVDAANDAPGAPA